MPRTRPSSMPRTPRARSWRSPPSAAQRVPRRRASRRTSSSSRRRPKTFARSSQPSVRSWKPSVSSWRSSRAGRRQRWPKGLQANPEAPFLLGLDRYLSATRLPTRCARRDASLNISLLRLGSLARTMFSSANPVSALWFCFIDRGRKVIMSGRGQVDRRFVR